MSFITVKNDGPKLVSSSFWESEYNQAGKFYLSINARCFRLLIPEPMETAIREMKTGNFVIVSIGPWPQMKKEKGIELLYEDNSDSPFSLHLSPEQADVLPAPHDNGRTDLMHMIYTRGCKLAYKCPARFRLVSQIPCLKPWD